jgi:hypothetical protein
MLAYTQEKNIHVKLKPAEGVRAFTRPMRRHR